MNRRLAMILGALEVLLGVLAVALDVFIPSLVILAAGLIFLVIRGERPGVYGFQTGGGFGRMTFQVFLFAVGWTVLDYCLFLPILNHLTGTTQEMGGFAELKGNVGQLAFLLAAGWILGAFCEEAAYRGILQTRIAGLFGREKLGIAFSVAVTSLLFGLAHMEQGIIGVIITTLDGFFFSFLRRKYGNTWASVLAHGFMNTIGIVTFFFTGPLYGLW